MNFETIWKEYNPQLASFIQKRIEDKVVVQDILQEVSLKLFNKLNSEVTIKNYKAWLFQVSRHTIADYYRKKQPTLSLPLDSTPDNLTGNCVCDLSSFVIKNYLPEKYATPLHLSDIEKRPQKEIAQVLNLSLTATKSRIQRGRKQLKELILNCVEVSYNNKAEITDFQLKPNCHLPIELLNEINRLKIVF